MDDGQNSVYLYKTTLLYFLQYVNLLVITHVSDKL